MSLRHIRHTKVFRVIASVLILQFLTTQIPVGQAEVQYQQDSESYQAEKPADSSEDPSNTSDSESDLPNPNDPSQDSPLSPASEEASQVGSGSSVPTGSIVIGTGNVYTNQNEVTLNLQVSSESLPGDSNGDGSVDAADYIVWRKLGGSQADYNLWRGNFGKTNQKEMAFSENGTDFTNWETFQSTKTWVFSGDGLKTIYVKFRDQDGNESEIYSASITLDTILPTVTLLSSPYVFDSDYRLHYRASDFHMESVDKTEAVELIRGWNDITRTFTDEAGNLREVTWKVFLDQNAERGTFFDYDANGNITAERTPNGDEIKYEYDANNNLIKIVYPDGLFVRYTYDGMGKRTSMQDSTGITFYIYDQANRLRRLIQPTGETIDYNYDNAGNLTQMIYAGKTIDYTYDEANRLKTVTDESGTTTYEYNDAGDLTKKILPNGIETAYSYDAAGRLDGISHTQDVGGVSVIHASVNYQLDAAGNRTEMRLYHSYGDPQDRVVDYVYDPFGRLTSEIEYEFSDTGNILRSTTNYAYDASGNRLTKEFIPATVSAFDPRILTRYTYGVDNRLESLVTEKYNALDALISSEEESFIYDAAGNLRQRATPSKTIYYEYDFENRLRLWFDGETFTEFIYDGDGNRVGKRVNGETTYYIVDPNREISQVLAELDSAGDVTETYTFGLDRISVTNLDTGLPSPPTHYALQDGLGSTLAFTGASGAMVEPYAYDAFGNLLDSPTLAISPFLYTGEQLDSETGLIYLRNRYYDPVLGRFISRDPVLGRLDQTQSFNSYPYVQNNPVNFVDPLGLEYDLRRRPLSNWKQWLWYISRDASHHQIVNVDNPRYDNFGLFESDEIRREDFRTYDTFANRYETLERFPNNSIVGQARTNLERSYNKDWCLFANDCQDFGSAFSREYNRLAKDDRDKSYYPGGNGPGGGSGGSRFTDSDRSFNSFNRSLLGSYQSGSRGGVLLDKALSVSGLSINDIAGVTFDPYTGQVVLLGEAGGAVPEIDMDYLIVALKAVFGSFQDPGVTIDPALDASGNKDWSQDQIVTHFGGIEDTALGWAVFEADRLMKSISHGKDNVTHTDFTQDGLNISESFIKSQAGLSEFQNMFTRWFANSDGSQSSRFWFVPKDMKLVRSNGHDTFVFDNNSVQLLTEDLLVGNGAEDPDAKAFADYFTAHYDQFAELYPIFEELKKAARAVAFAKFIRDHDIPVDLNWLKNAPLPVVPTPRTTPVGVNSVTWTTTRPIPGGTEIITHTYTIRGGVSVDFINGANFTYLTDVLNEASGLRSDSLGVRPNDLATSWNFNSDGTSYDATALSLAPTRKDANFYWQEPDLSFDTTGDFNLKWTRFYDSFDASGTRLGFGWHFTPFAIESTEGSQPYLIDNQVRWLFPKIRFQDRANQLTEDMVLSYLLQDGTFVYVPDGKATSSSLMVHPDNTFTFVYSDRRKVHFLADGTLDYLEDENGNRIDYAYDAFNRLDAITDSRSGKQIELVYDASGRVAQVNGPENKSIIYTYDLITGDLKTETESWTNRTTTYFYDAEHRLTSAQDHTQKTLFANTYDDMGRLETHIDENGNLTEFDPDLLSHETLSNDPINDAQSKQTYDSLFRLTQNQDALGNQMNYVYGGNYGPTSMMDPRGNSTSFGYDLYGNENRKTDPLNHISRFDYASFFGDSRLIFNEEGNGLGQYLEYHDTGNLKSIMEGALPIRDASGNLTGYYTTPFVTQFDYDPNGNLSVVTDANSHTTAYDYDSVGNLKKVTNALQKSTEFTYEMVEIPSDHVVTGHGDVQIDTAQSQFGGASARFDGSGDYLSVGDQDDFDFGTGDFTIDFRTKFASWPNTHGLFAHTSGAGEFWADITSGANVYVMIGGVLTAFPNAVSNLEQDTWYHFAFVRENGVLTLYINGTAVASGVNNGNADSNAAFEIGRDSENSRQFNGWLDEFRISKGTARWSTDFTPPTDEYAADGDASLLLHFNGEDGSRDFPDAPRLPQMTNRLSSIQDPLNRITNFVYDPVTHNLTRVSTARSEMNYGYDSRDRISSITNPMNHVTQFQYRDSIDKITETRELGNVANPLDDIIATFDYDRFGNLTSLAGPLGGATSFAYDILNRLARIIAPETTPLAGANSVVVQDITTASAQIQLEAAESLARVVIRYHVEGETAYQTFTQEEPLAGSIAFNLDGLQAGTKYVYEVEMIDADGHHSFTRERSFTTQGTPPIPGTEIKAQNLSGNVYDVTSTTASIGVLNPEVNYQLVDFYRITVTPVGGGNSIVRTFEPVFQGSGGYYVTNLVQLTGLQTNTNYTYQVEIVPYSGAPFDVPTPVQGTFKTANPLDTIVPQITGRVLAADIDQAVLTLSTNEPLLKAEVGVRNLNTDEVQFFEFFNPASGAQLLIDHLLPETAYAYWVYMTDRSGNDVFSTVQTFVTDGFDADTSIVLENRVTARGATTAAIEVFSDELLSVLKIQYRLTGETNWTEQAVTPAGFKTQVDLTGLASGADYEYRLDVRDSAGNRRVTENRSLILSPVTSEPPALNSNGIFSLALDENILTEAALSGTVGFSLALAEKFLGTFSDEYDYLVFIPTLSGSKRLSLAKSGLTEENDLGSFYLGAQNNVQGIGDELFDARSFFGSSAAGELEGMVLLDSGLSSGPDFRFGSSDFTQNRNQVLWENVLTQELAHRFGSFLTSSDGNPYGLLGRAQSHWGVFFDADFSSLDGNDWADNGDGTFTLIRSYIDEAAVKQSSEAMPYNDLDLYTMGLLNPGEVGPMFVIENPTLDDGRAIRPHVNDPDNSLDAGPYVDIQNPNGTWSGPYYLPSDFVIHGTRREITLSDIVALEGSRIPSSNVSQKDFKAAFVLLTGDEETLLDESEASKKLARFQDNFLDFFDAQTRNLGSLSLPSLDMVSSNGAASGLMGVIASAAKQSQDYDSLLGFSSREEFIQRMNEKLGHDHDLPENIQSVSFGENALHSVSDSWTAGSSAFGVRLANAFTPFVAGDLLALSNPIAQFGSLIPLDLTQTLPGSQQSLSPEFLQKPVLYSDWKGSEGLKTSDPFASDPTLGSPLPQLVSVDKLHLSVSNPVQLNQPTVDSEPAVKTPPQNITNPLRGRIPTLLARGKNPNFSFTPLNWSALSNRYEKRDKNEGKQNLISFVRSKKKNKAS